MHRNEKQWNLDIPRKFVLNLISSLLCSKGVFVLIRGIKRMIFLSPSRYRWQRGFRKAANGRYVKVPILKAKIGFAKDLENEIVLVNKILMRIGNQPRLLHVS